MRKVLNSLLLIGAVTSQCANAEWVGPLYSVKDFDISDMKLGMESSEIVRILKDKYDIDEDAIDIVVSDGVVMSVSYKTDELATTAKFIRIIAPNGKHVDLARMIILNQPNGESSAILDGSVGKFGNPSRVTRFGEKTYYDWCSGKSEKDSARCDKNQATYSFNDGTQLKLETSEYFAVQNAQRKQRVLNKKAPHVAYAPEKLHSHLANLRVLPAEDTSSVSGVENCPKLWNAFVDWYSRVLVIGDTVQDGDEAWFRENGYSTRSILSSNELNNSEFHKLHLAPALGIERIMEVAVVCDKNGELPNTTRFVAGQYLNVAGELGRFMLRKRRGDNFFVTFFVTENNPYYEHAIKYNFFQPLLPEFDSLVSQFIITFAEERRSN